MSLADYHKEFEMLAKIVHEVGVDFVTMGRMERERKIVYPITAANYFTDHQKEEVYNKIRERYMVIVFVMSSNQNKYGWSKEDCNNSYNSQNNHR